MRNIIRASHLQEQMKVCPKSSTKEEVVVLLKKSTNQQSEQVKVNQILLKKYAIRLIMQ
jgi:Ca2+-binding EF-hand superfamily protein